MRHKRKVGAIACLEENSHESNKPHHSAKVFRVKHTDDNQKDTRQNADEMDPELLSPQVMVRPLVNQVADEATKGARDNVQQAEHSGPSPRVRLSQVLEVLEVVGTEDGIDSEFAAEGAHVAGAQHECLKRAQHVHGFLEGRLLDDFVLDFVEDLDFASDVAGAGFGVFGLLRIAFLLIVGGHGVGDGGLVGEAAGCGDDGLVVRGGYDFVAVGPTAGWGVLGEEDDAHSGCGDENEGDDESDTPCDVRSQTAPVNEGVEDGGHSEADWGQWS